jgi:hypothetical protein
MLCLFYADRVLMVLGLLFYGMYGDPAHVEDIMEKYLALFGAYEMPERIG